MPLPTITSFIFFIRSPMELLLWSASLMPVMGLVAGGRTNAAQAHDAAPSWALIWLAWCMAFEVDIGFTSLTGEGVNEDFAGAVLPRAGPTRRAG